VAKKEENTGGIQIIDVNKRARRDYEITSTLEAGIALVGSEVKSIRAGGVNLKESYIKVKNNEAFLVGCQISPYSHAAVDAHETMREKKLLLHRNEIERLQIAIEQKGLTIVPLKIYFKKGRCKLEIAVGRGKKSYDKRHDIKAREAAREIEKGLKWKNR
jgi:SsrA-binding protein